GTARRAQRLSQDGPATRAPIVPADPGGENMQNKGEDAGADSPINFQLRAVPQPETEPAPDEIKSKYEKLEQESLEALKQELQEELEKIDSVFGELKDQILIDYTALGLRIQIVDKEQRPMFDLGSSRLKPYSGDVLKALSPLLDVVPNHL